MRTLSVKQLLSIKHKTFPFTGIWQEAFNSPETTGTWLVYGNEKNGKTTFCLMLTKYLSQFEKVLYISAEEKFSMNMASTVKRVGLDEINGRVKIAGYEAFEDLKKRLEKRECPKVIIIDNCSVYNDEITKKEMKDLLNTHQNKLFIMIAHQERGEPSTALARFCKKMAKLIVKIEGNIGYIDGRLEGREAIIINEEQAQLYWADRI